MHIDGNAPLNGLTALGADDCIGLEPAMLVVNHAAGEELSPAVAALLDPIQQDSVHCWMLENDRATKLHYHDNDEYWAWVKGRTHLTIRLPDGRSDAFDIGPGWVVYCVRGVEHGHEPMEDWGCYEWVGLRRPGVRTGHLTRELPDASSARPS